MQQVHKPNIIAGNNKSKMCRPATNIQDKNLIKFQREVDIVNFSLATF